MATRFDSFQRPPVPEEPVLPEVWPFVQHEARRQLEAFYPVLDEVTEKRTIRSLESGIYSMLQRGAARLYRGAIEFWNPVEGRFQRYDADYNTLMLDFMRDFNQRYRQHAMWSNAHLN